jgi:hypothetical protein
MEPRYLRKLWKRLDLIPGMTRLSMFPELYQMDGLEECPPTIVCESLYEYPNAMALDGLKDSSSIRSSSFEKIIEKGTRRTIAWRHDAISVVCSWCFAFPGMNWHMFSNGRACLGSPSSKQSCAVEVHHSRRGRDDAMMRSPSQEGAGEHMAGIAEVPPSVDLRSFSHRETVSQTLRSNVPLYSLEYISDARNLFQLSIIRPLLVKTSRYGVWLRIESLVEVARAMSRQSKSPRERRLLTQNRHDLPVRSAGAPG